MSSIWLVQSLGSEPILSSSKIAIRKVIFFYRKAKLSNPQSLTEANCVLSFVWRFLLSNVGCYNSIAAPDATEIMAMNSACYLRDCNLMFMLGTTEKPVGGLSK